MLVLLPPSEGKAAGGEGPPLDLARLSFAEELAPLRQRLGDALVAVSARPRAGFTALGLSAGQADELARNRELRDAPTMPAIERYTGVLYDALEIGSLTPAARRRADERLLVASALFGLLGAGDPIPAYRMSAGARLPRLGTLASRWKPALGPVLEQLAAEHLLVDLRSGSYQALAPAPAAVAVRVLSERPDGTRRVVSHANKSTRGLVARELARSRREPSTVGDVEDLLTQAGMRVEREQEQGLAIVLDAS